MKCLLMMT